MSPPAAARAGMVLSARGLAGAPPGVAALAFEGVTLELAPGTWTAITGPNGSGKTTLALTLAGLWPPRAGTLELGHARAGAAGGGGVAPSARIATILQEPSTQITQRTVRDEIAFTAQNLGASPAAARRLAEQWAARFGLDELLERAPDELSAGQQQRVLLAQALASDPDLLIADEATAHLDPASRDQVFEILRSQVDTGLALVGVTQVPDELARAFEVVTILAPARTGEPSAIARGGLGAAPLDEPEAEVFDSSIREPDVAIRIHASERPKIGARVQSPDGLELMIGTRGVWAIVGPNGSGKSSLLEALAGVLEVPEVEIRSRSARVPAPLLVGQYPERQIFEERVEDEILFAAVRRGRDRHSARAHALALCAAMGYDPGFLERRTWSLSAGEKRLVSLIGAMIAPASLLLLDEPTCGIDFDRRSVLARWIRSAARHHSVVVASQDLSWLREVEAIEVSLGSRNGRMG